MTGSDTGEEGGTAYEALHAGLTPKPSLQEVLPKDRMNKKVKVQKQSHYRPGQAQRITGD